MIDICVPIWEIRKITKRALRAFSFICLINLIWRLGMTPSEQNSRETIISFLMEQTGLSRQETVTSIEELEAFGLVGFASNGDFRLKEV